MNCRGEGSDADISFHFAVPGDLATLTGGYGYARELMAAIPATGLTLHHVVLPGSFPKPTGADIVGTQRAFAGLPETAVVLVDGLAYGALPGKVLADITQTMVPLVHHPLALETGISAAERHRLEHSERNALAHARHVIVTSANTAHLLADTYGVSAERITVAVPGTFAARRATGSRPDAASRNGMPGPLSLLCVGTVTPRKGYTVLVEALARLQDLDWNLRIVGDTSRSPREVAAVREALERTGLGNRIHFAGILETAALDAAYCSSDVFVMPSLYEGFGMVLTEAMAHGLPIVSTTGGAAAETVPDGAALKVAPHDAPALEGALRAMLADPSLRAATAERSWAAGEHLPRWNDTASTVAGVLHAAAMGRAA